MGGALVSRGRSLCASPLRAAGFSRSSVPGRRAAGSDSWTLAGRGHDIFTLLSQSSEEGIESAASFLQRSTNRQPQCGSPITCAKRTMTCRTRLDHATSVVYAEFVTVDVTEVNLYAGQLPGKSLEDATHFAFNEVDYARVYVNILIAIDLSPHVFL